MKWSAKWSLFEEGTLDRRICSFRLSSVSFSFSTGYNRSSRRPPGMATRRWLVLETIRLTLITLSLCRGTSAQDCCQEEPTPISSCSFYSPSQEKHILCNLTYFDSGGMPCFDNSQYTTDKDDIPARVSSLHVKPFVTSCAPSLPSAKRVGEVCRTPCSDRSGIFHVGVNITFQIEKYSANKLTDVELNLYGFNDPHAARTFCAIFSFSGSDINYYIASTHVFFFDGFIGLTPGAAYEVRVRSLPTAGDGQESVKSQRIRIPYECWNANIIDYDVPFAVNISLELDIGEDYKEYSGYITEYHIQVCRDSCSYAAIDEKRIPNQASTPITGPVFRNIAWSCMEPGNYEVEIDALGCDLCIPAQHFVTVKAGKPSIQGCPIGPLHAKVNDRGVAALNWEEPWVVPSTCENMPQLHRNQTHRPQHNFTESAEVVYMFWWYDRAVAICSFYVNVTEDADTELEPGTTKQGATPPSPQKNTGQGLDSDQLFRAVVIGCVMGTCLVAFLFSCFLCIKYPTAVKQCTQFIIRRCKGCKQNNGSSVPPDNPIVLMPIPPGTSGGLWDLKDAPSITASTAHIPLNTEPEEEECTVIMLPNHPPNISNEDNNWTEGGERGRGRGGDGIDQRPNPHPIITEYLESGSSSVVRNGYGPRNGTREESAILLKPDARDSSDRCYDSE